MKTKNIILGAVLAILGIVMIAIPDTCIKAVVVIVGAAAVTFSVYNLLVVYKQSEDAAFKKTLLIKSIITFVVGLISVICPFVLVKTVETIFKIFSFILAAYLILYAGVSVYSSAKMRADFPEESKRLIFEALIFVAIAILLILIPIDQFGQAFVRIVGLGGLIIGLVMVAVEIVVSKRTATEEAPEADITKKMDQQAQAEAGTSAATDTPEE
ncbi:MAG: DUF308 domain-containing protein [Treponema sp.]|nr:DUF308 domain-containing protein [Treponema sp.]